jgi:Flp pilus assembly protein TadG
MKSESGQSVVEFALVLPMLMVVCVGMAELGRATWAWNMAQMAASEGARRAIVIGAQQVPPGSGNNVYAWKDTVTAGVNSILYGRDGKTEGMFSGAKIAASVDHSVTPNLVVVDVDVPVHLFARIWSKAGNGADYHLHGRASMPVQPAFKEGP